MKKCIKLYLSDETETDIQKIKNRQCKITFIDKIGDNETFISYSFNKENIIFTKPIYIGFCFRISKKILYQW